jgi:tetratricopeptide (TPR) repeat protein
MCACITAAAQTGAATAGSSDRASVLRQGKALLAAHRPEAAAQELSTFLATHPDDADALNLLAQTRLDEGDPSAAEELLTKALASSPNSPAANLTLGDLLLNEHHDPEAMDRFETVLSINLRSVEARRGELAAVTELAISMRRENHQQAALQALEHARTKLPDDPKLLFELGVQADELGRLPEADEVLNAARKLNPEDLDTLYALARVETGEQHMPAAEADFRAYLAKRPEDASARFGLGRVLAAEQRTEEARAEFERSVQLQPVQTESYYELGQLELEAQHDAQAEPFFRKVLERDPTHGGALTGMGILAFRRKDYAQAEQYLATAEKIAPEYQPAHYYRGLALTRLGQKQEADRELQLATQLDREQQGPPGISPRGSSVTPGDSHPQ